MGHERRGGERGEETERGEGTREEGTRVEGERVGERAKMKRGEEMTSRRAGVQLSEPNSRIVERGETSLRSGRLKRRSDSAL